MQIKSNKIMLIYTLFTSLAATNVNANICFLTAMKDNCWKNYTVSIKAIDSTMHAVVAQVVIPQGKSYTRTNQFTCAPNQSFEFQAQFTPTIWQGKENEVYVSRHFWQLPESLQSGEKAWNINLCFAADFENLPMPLNEVSPCVCDASIVPAIPPL